MTPRPYLSYTQLSLYERSPERYYQKYFLGEEIEETEAMAFGKRFHEIIEHDEKTEDLIIEHVKNFLPSYPEREYQFHSVCNVGKEVVPLLCVFDGYDDKKRSIGEFKTGRKWTQKMADELGQLTFYAFAYWQVYRELPKELSLIWIETTETYAGVQATGYVRIFQTTRTIHHMIQMQQRIEKAWKGIKELSDKEYKSIL
jgi:hypothetical protein